MTDVPDDYEFGAGVFDATPREKRMELHAWARHCLPATASEFMRELLLMHRALPDAVANLPKDAVELSAAVRGLEREGLFEQRDKLWFWKAEAAKPEPQMALFGDV